MILLHTIKYYLRLYRIHLSSKRTEKFEIYQNKLCPPNLLKKSVRINEFLTNSLKILWIFGCIPKRAIVTFFCQSISIIWCTNISLSLVARFKVSFTGQILFFSLPFLFINIFFFYLQNKMYLPRRNEERLVVKN